MTGETSAMQCDCDVLVSDDLNLYRVQIPPDHFYCSPQIGKKVKSCIVGMSSADTSFLHHCTASIKDFHHPDLPALLVFIEYITQLEVGFGTKCTDTHYFRVFTVQGWP